MLAGCNGGDGATATVKLRVRGPGQVGAVVSNAVYAESFGRLACGSGIPDQVCFATHDLDAGPFDLTFSVWPSRGWVVAGWSGDCSGATLRVDTEKAYECAVVIEGNNGYPGGYCSGYAGADGYLDAAWDPVPLRTVGTASQTVGGEPVDTVVYAYPVGQHTSNVGLPVDPTTHVSRIAVAYIRNDVEFIPSALDGPLPEILAYHEAHFAASNPDSLDVEWGLALQQGGVVYTTTGGVFRSNVLERSNVVAGTLVPAGFNGSITGAPIRFGYYRSVSTVENPPAGSTVVHDIMSWSVDFCH